MKVSDLADMRKKMRDNRNLSYAAATSLWGAWVLSLVLYDFPMVVNLSFAGICLVHILISSMNHKNLSKIDDFIVYSALRAVEKTSINSNIKTYPKKLFNKVMIHKKALDLGEEWKIEETKNNYLIIKK
jgi:uncharacterized protein YeeX (DUF496 family)